MKLLLLASLMLTSSVFAQERYTPTPLTLLTERIDGHDKEIADLKQRVCDLEDERNLLKEQAERKPVEVQLTIAQSPVVPVAASDQAATAPMERIISETIVCGFQVANQPPSIRHSTARRLKTTAELRADIARSRTNRVYGRMARGQERLVYRHLTGEHGYAASQVNGLSLNDALMLHNLAHGPRINAYVSSRTAAAAPVYTSTTVAASAPDIFIPTPNSSPRPRPQPPTNWTPPSGGNCANGRCARSRSTGGWYFGKLLGR